MTNAALPALRLLPLNGVTLALRRWPGAGTPVVWIHGSFEDHHGWLDTVAALARRDPHLAAQSVVYDRRGHSASPSVPGQGTITEDAQDAAALIASLDRGPAHVVGHSYGANIAMVLAQLRPELVKSVVLYEPPVFGLLQPSHPELLAGVKEPMLRAKGLMEGGSVEAGVVVFAEQVAFGPGSWDQVFDPRARRTMVANAETWLDQTRDPQRLSVQTTGLVPLGNAVTVVGGEASLPAYPVVNQKVVDQIPGAILAVIPGAGHGGPASHPVELAHVVHRHVSRVP